MHGAGAEPSAGDPVSRKRTTPGLAHRCREPTQAESMDPCYHQEDGMSRGLGNKSPRMWFRAPAAKDRDDSPGRGGDCFAGKGAGSQ